MAKTPKPNPDLFNEASFLTSKKYRTSTPSLKPPKPPTKSMQRYNNCSISNTSFRSAINKQQSNIANNAQSHFLNFNQHKNLNSRRLYKEFTNVSKIGSGHFANVYKAQSLKDGQYYAIKKTSERYTSESDRQRKLQEVRNLLRIPKHNNIIRYYDYWEEDDYLYIQTELCQTSLNQFVESCPDNKLPENLVWDYLVDLLLAIKHLHDNDLLHLDIKPDNLLISDNGVLKMGDFGLLYDLKKQHNSTFQMEGPSLFDDYSIEKSDESEIVEEGDSKYLASETMQGKFTKAADIFSIGITIFEIATGMDLPTNGTLYHMLRHNEIEDLYLNGLSKDMIQIIKFMMEQDYTKRSTADDILKLKVVKKHVTLRTFKTKVYTRYSTIISLITWMIATFFSVIFKKVFPNKIKNEQSFSNSSDNSDSDRLDVSTNFDIFDNGYDSEESYCASKIRPKKLLDVFDQLDAEE